jgi:hypothetical protein
MMLLLLLSIRIIERISISLLTSRFSSKHLLVNCCGKLVSCMSCSRIQFVRLLHHSRSLPSSSVCFQRRNDMDVCLLELRPVDETLLQSVLAFVWNRLYGLHPHFVPRPRQSRTSGTIGPLLAAMQLND